MFQASLSLFHFPPSDPNNVILFQILSYSALSLSWVVVYFLIACFVRFLARAKWCSKIFFSLLSRSLLESTWQNPGELERFFLPFKTFPWRAARGRIAFPHKWLGIWESMFDCRLLVALFHRQILPDRTHHRRSQRFQLVRSPPDFDWGHFCRRWQQWCLEAHITFFFYTPTVRNSSSFRSLLETTS